MVHLTLVLLGAAVVGVIGFGVTWLLAGRDRGLASEEPDSVAVPLPTTRPLTESDVQGLRFDTAVRGYRMGQVDAALRRAAYDIGYKEELINVLEAENAALRDGRTEDADELRDARVGSATPDPGAGRGAESGSRPSREPSAGGDMAGGDMAGDNTGDDMAGYDRAFDDGVGETARRDPAQDSAAAGPSK